MVQVPSVAKIADGQMSNIVAQVSNLATAANSWSDEGLGQISSLVGSFVPEITVIGSWSPRDPLGLTGINADEPIVPTPDPVAVEDVTFEGTDPVVDPPVISSDPPPDPWYEDPGIDIPPAPTDPFPPFAETPPSITTPNFPNPPDVTLPPMPIIDDIVFPTPPDLIIPDFEGTPPTMNLDPPEPVFSWNEQPYSDPFYSVLVDRMMEEVVNGGSGLNLAWENAFLARMTANLEEKEEEMYLEAQNVWAERGFTMPPGALAGQMIELQHRVLKNRENLLNDIIIKQEEVAFEYSKFIINASVTFHSYIFQNYNSYMQRSFDAAKFGVESALIIYQARIEAYKAQLESYKTMALVYEAKIRAEMAKAELYKAQIEGIKAQVDVKEALIQAYTAQVQGIQATVEVYKAEMEGARIIAEVDRTKIEAFKALVDAYEARINAITAKYNAYTAQVKGEEAKARAYAAQVDAYKSEVEAYEVGARVDIARAEAALKVVDADVRVFQGYVEKYKGDVEHAVRKAAAEVEIEKLDVDIYSAEVRNYEAELRTLSEVFRSQVTDARAAWDIVIASINADAEIAKADATVTSAGIRATATVSAALGAAALSQVSVSTSSSARAGVQDSTMEAGSGIANEFSYVGTQVMDITNRIQEGHRA